MKTGTQYANCTTHMKSGHQNQYAVNFESPTLKNKNFKILTFRGPGGQNGGPEPKFSN